MSTAEAIDQSELARPWRPKAIVFDLLTALVDAWSVHDASMPPGTIQEANAWRRRYLDLTYGNQGGYVPWEELIARSAVDVGLPESTAQNLFERWSRDLKPWPEVPGVLVRLKQQGFLLGIVTNCSIKYGQQAVDAAEGAIREELATSFDSKDANEPLDGEARNKDFCFDAVVTAEGAGYYKPAKEAYNAILPILGVKIEDVLFCAGSAGDVQGASNAGLKVVWHNRMRMTKRGSAEPLKEGNTLAETLEGFL